jgi:hypothetical protein
VVQQHLVVVCFAPACRHPPNFTSLQGQLPDYNEPVIIPRNKATVEDFCNRIHKVRCRLGLRVCGKPPLSPVPHAVSCMQCSPWQCIVPSQACHGWAAEHGALLVLQGILRNLKYALVWGSSTKHRPQKVRSMSCPSHEVLACICVFAQDAKLLMII